MDDEIVPFLDEASMSVSVSGTASLSLSVSKASYESYETNGSYYAARAKRFIFDIYYEWDEKNQKWFKIVASDPDPINLAPGKFDGQIIALNRNKYLQDNNFV